MDPAPLVLTVHLIPIVVFAVPDPPYSGPCCSAQHAEAVCKFSSSSSSGF